MKKKLLIIIIILLITTSFLIATHHTPVYDYWDDYANWNESYDEYFPPNQD